MYLQAVSQKHQTVLAKLELPHFIETAFMHSWQANDTIRYDTSVFTFGLIPADTIRMFYEYFSTNNNVTSECSECL